MPGVMRSDVVWFSEVCVGSVFGWTTDEQRVIVMLSSGSNILDETNTFVIE